VRPDGSGSPPELMRLTFGVTGHVLCERSLEYAIAWS
jgi:hypothetical protein